MKKFTLEVNRKVDLDKKHQTDNVWDFVFEPGDPMTRCTVFDNYTRLTDGIGVRKHGDTYDLETGCRMALKSALRRVSDKQVRALAWAAYLERFPVGERTVEIEVDIPLELVHVILGHFVKSALIGAASSN